MTTGQWLFWLGALMVGFIGSALYSGLETGSYRLNRVRLQNRMHRNDPRANALGNLIMHPVALLGTLLIGNNLMNYMGTAGLTVILEDRGLTEWQMVVANILIVTPLLFVFGETLPKDLFGAYADRLMYRLLPILTLSKFAFTITGMLPLINIVTRAIFRVQGKQRGTIAFHPRRQMELLVKEGVGMGLLSEEQTAIVERALSLSTRRVRDEMLPWKDVKTLAESSPTAKLWELAERSSRSRFPLMNTNGEVVGIVNIMDALVHTRENCPPLDQLKTEALTIDADLPLRDGLRKLQARGQHLAIVAEKNKPIGIVTIKDLVEPITGELASW